MTQGDGRTASRRRRMKEGGAMTGVKATMVRPVPVR
jgi:hypothetical protein